MKTGNHSPADNQIFLTVAISMVAVFAIGMPLTAKYITNKINENVVLTVTQFESATSDGSENSELSPSTTNLALEDCKAAPSTSGGFRLACPDIAPVSTGPQVAGEQIKADAAPLYSWDNWLSAVVSLLGF